MMAMAIVIATSSSAHNQVGIYLYVMATTL